MSTSNLLDIAAELGSEEEDEDFDEDTGEARRRTNGTNGALDDSSEEEDDDDNEEEARAIREGFIVDEDEDEEEQHRRRREKKKRRRAEREEEEAVLDEEDLDLIGEANPEYQRREPPRPKFKRLKQGHKEDRANNEPRGMFSDDEDDVADNYDDRRAAANDPFGGDEFADFIEEDDPDDDGRDQDKDDAEVRRPARKGPGGIADMQSTGLDEASLEDMRAAFGDGTEYDWALEQEAVDEDQHERDKVLELKDVFEPSQLIDRMLTDEDNEIRNLDVPERFQIARKIYKQPELSDEEAAARAREESLWISNMMLPKKRFGLDGIEEPFQKSIAKVLDLMNREDFEVPFIFQHRKDYLIHAAKVDITPDPNNHGEPDYEVKAEKLLNQSDLWEVFDLDLKFRALVEKREALQRAYDNLKAVSPEFEDEVFVEMLPGAVTMEELQDIQDYLHFQYSAQLKDASLMDAEANGIQKRSRATRSVYERLRSGKVYHLVKAFGITADQFAQNALHSGRKRYTEDTSERPDDMADGLIDPPEYNTGSHVLRAAKAMFAEEIATSPRMRSLMRRTYYTGGEFDCYRTEKGLKKIDEDHSYYEFKYLRGQTFNAIARRPDLYLRMLKAEDEGLVDVKLSIQGFREFKQKLYQEIESDNFSEIADAWNALRREVLDMALQKLEKIIVKGVKETMKTECENQIARSCREEYSKRLDQAPYKPKGMVLGTVPRILALSNGTGNIRDAICWAWVEEDGRVLENGKFTDLRLGNSEKLIPDGRDIAAFVELVERRKPDVIAVSGFSVETRKLYKDLQDIIEERNLRGASFEDDDGREVSAKLEVIIVNDEVARLYHTSERSFVDYPGLAPTTKYCVALAKYLQDPMKEYAALGRDIISISFDPSQNLVPEEKLLKALETAMVDMVNLVGVDINEAVADPYIANLLPYVCGLGPRKAAQLLKVINLNGGRVSTRDELVGDPSMNKKQAVGPKVWANCASFVYIEFDPTDLDLEYLDNTRVHPEDYEIARKMAADAMELDEEDIKAETDENGLAAIVRKLKKEEQEERVNDLVLEEYAEQLEIKFNQKKRATLETIRAELQQPYEELRRNFALLSTDEIFTMLTGETKESLAEGMVVPVKIRKVFSDHIEVKLDCGVDGNVADTEYPDGVGQDTGLDPRQVYSVHQTVQGKLMFLNRKALTASLSFRESELRRPYRRPLDHHHNEWDEAQEAQDKKEAIKESDEKAGRVQRVIKHPLFRPFNATQAEEFLGSQGRGDVVIRPSSKGMDHLAVTWKVSDSVYQHIDVLELDKDNEFSVGRTLKIAGKYSYSDLDELIVNHVKAMAKKVDEMMGDERYQSGSRQQTEQWLTTYTEANPKRSMYAFCINPKYPGYFFLCFKAGQHAALASWPVK
ncbi:Transcription elongation factor spt6, partial [Cryomyces minteri]